MHFHELFSERELQVLQLMLEEYTSQEIADKLFISKRTVDTHRINIMDKSGCKTIICLYKKALLTGLVTK